MKVSIVTRKVIKTVRTKVHPDLLLSKYKSNSLFYQLGSGATQLTATEASGQNERFEDGPVEDRQR